MKDSLLEAFDKKLGTQSVSGLDYKMKDRLDLFHAFVIEQFGEQEINSSDISSRMKKCLGVKIANYFGCQLNSIVDDDELNRLFYIQKGEHGLIKLKAKVPPIVSYVGEELRKQMASASNQKVNVREGMPRMNGLKTEIKHVDEDQYFFGTYIRSYNGSHGFSVPAVDVVFIEKKGVQINSVVLLDNRYSMFASRDEFVIGRGDASGAPVLLDISQRAIFIRKWTDFEESRSMDFKSALMQGSVTATLGKRRFACRELMILADGKLYAGFYLQNLKKRIASYVARDVKVSKVGYNGFNDLCSILDFLGDNGIVPTMQEELHIGIPKKDRWQSTDAFCADNQIWDELKVETVGSMRAIVSNGMVVDVAATNEESVGKTKVVETSDADLAQQTDLAGSGYCNCSEKEQAFVKKLISAIESSGYVYDSRDIIRFHTSVKTGMITLLGGAPGCGKSSLARLYAMALQGQSVSNGFLAVDVSPAWTEPQDLLGYWNLDGKYILAPSGLVAFLQDANQKDSMRLVCLEEMNLARVEHYFADFIQAFSRDENDRVIHGVPAEGQSKGAELVLTPNVRFVGTNNYDETTQQISARFYDRCNYIELVNVAAGEPFSGTAPSVNREKFDFGVSYQEYDSWFKREWQKFDNVVLEKMVELRPLLESLRLSVSKRVENAIAKYIVNRPFFRGCGRETKRECQLMALDEAIAQRVLPRYRPNLETSESSNVKKLLKALKPLDISYGFFESVTNSKELPQ